MARTTQDYSHHEPQGFPSDTRVSPGKTRPTREDYREHYEPHERRRKRQPRRQRQPVTIKDAETGRTLYVEPTTARRTLQGRKPSSGGRVNDGGVNRADSQPNRSHGTLGTVHGMKPADPTLYQQ